MAAPADLTEMQCLWFLQEEGDSYRRNGNLAMALKRYQSLATVCRRPCPQLMNRLSETTKMIITISTNIVYVG